ncbi:MAG: hypothetical protein SPC23_11470 [Lachnospiraceae bacterium]|nr:hypothetical protein [Lachnospiraceae bacterium]
MILTCWLRLARKKYNRNGEHDMKEDIKAPIETERKWLVNDWPEETLPLLLEQEMDQGYISVHPTVRVRRESTVFSALPEVSCQNAWILCLKSGGTLSRKEIEIAIPEQKYHEIEDLIGRPLIPKTRRTYLLDSGLHLEVNHVDAGQPSEFWYAEIEFPDPETAMAYDPSEDCLSSFLSHEVTGQPGQSMGAYWEKTRL